MKRFLLPILGTLLIVTLAGCSQAPPPEVTEHNNPVTVETGYPLDIFDAESAYPGYPVVTDEGTLLNQGPDFNIEEPVLGGDYSLSGTGPAGVPIELIDVFMGGELLGKTTIREGGSFTFDLSTALVTGHSIGIQLGDISNTDLNQADFLYNDTYLDVPLIGILFDMVVVE